MAHLYVFFLAAILLSTAELCLGLWIGIRFGRTQEQKRSIYRAVHSGRHDGDDSLPWTECLVLVDSMAQQLQSLVLASARCQPALPHQISAELSELQKVTVALQQRIRSGPVDQPEPSSANSRQTGPVSPLESSCECQPACTHEDGAAGSVQPGDLSDAIENAPSAGIDNEPHLFTYDAIGYMAPCDEHDVPHPDAFRRVTCHAISVHTISFYGESPPDYEFLTISVGPVPQVLFILCRVRHFREVYLDQQHRYLISCEFTRRLGKDEIRWQDVYGRTTHAQEGCGSSNERTVVR